jgi:hypothetical protein
VVPSYVAQVAGNATFLSAPVESYSLHVHILQAAGASAPTHALVWRPVPVGEVEAADDIQTHTFDVGFVATGPAAAAWRLTGVAPDGAAPASLPNIAAGTWTMAVSSIPTLVVLA